MKPKSPNLETRKPTKGELEMLKKLDKEKKCPCPGPLNKHAASCRFSDQNMNIDKIKDKASKRNKHRQK